MNNYLRLLAIFVIITTIPSNSESAYLVTGQIQGEVCKGWKDYVCKLVNVNAASGYNGEGLYDLRSIYYAVSEYDSTQKVCNIQIRGSTRKLSGLISDLNRLFIKRTKFYEKRINGAYYEVNARKLMFPCRIK